MIKIIKDYPSFYFLNTKTESRLALAYQRSDHRFYFEILEMAQEFASSQGQEMEKVKGEFKEEYPESWGELKKTIIFFNETSYQKQAIAYENEKYSISLEKCYGTFHVIAKNRNGEFYISKFVTEENKAREELFRKLEQYQIKSLL